MRLGALVYSADDPQVFVNASSPLIWAFTPFGTDTGPVAATMQLDFIDNVGTIIHAEDPSLVILGPLSDFSNAQGQINLLGTGITCDGCDPGPDDRLIFTITSLERCGTGRTGDPICAVTGRVPEPAAIGLWLLGLSGIALLRRRRARAAG